MDEQQLYLLAQDSTKVKTADKMQGEFIQGGSISGTTDSNGFYSITFPSPYTVLQGIQATLVQSGFDGTTDLPALGLTIMSASNTQIVLRLQTIPAETAAPNASITATWLATGQ